MNAELDIKHVRGMSILNVRSEIEQGARFVVFQYCVSCCFVTFAGWSRVYYLREGQRATSVGRLYTLLSLLLGWWGLPWGIIRTVRAVSLNIDGGQDVTVEVMERLGIPLSPFPALQPFHPYRAPALDEDGERQAPAEAPRDEWDDKLDEELRRL